MQLKIASWNIWQSRHVDQVIETLSKIQPDIVGLQEVYDTQEKNAGQTIAEALGLQHVYCKALELHDRTPQLAIGNSILSRYVIKNSTCHFLSSLEQYRDTPESEPRTAQETTVEIDETTLTIMNLHMGYSPDLIVTPIQKLQLQKLQLLLKKERFILMGDFNSLPQSEVIVELEKQLQNTDKMKTIPTRFTQTATGIQEDRIDYIFTSSDIRVDSFTILPQTASDHSLLLAELEL